MQTAYIVKARGAFYHTTSTVAEERALERGTVRSMIGYGQSLEDIQASFYASVTMSNATGAILHSVAKIPVEVPSPSSFLETLQSFGNGSLWDNLSFEGDGEWIG